MLMEMSDGDIDSDSRNDDKDIEQPLFNTKTLRQPHRRPRRMKKFKRKRQVAQCVMISGILLLALAVIIGLVYVFSTVEHRDNYLSSSKNVHSWPSTKSQTKKILIWGHEHNWHRRYQLNSDFLQYSGCRIYDCSIDRGRLSILLQRYDAVVYDADYKDAIGVVKNPLHIYASSYLQQGASRNMLPDDGMHYDFNLTMSYRTDSDIIWTKYVVVNRNGDAIAPSQNPHWNHANKGLNTVRDFDLQKTNFALIRICQNTSVGAKFYQELKNYIPPPMAIDVESTCEISDPNQTSRLRKYKFLLAFEDSLCTDNISKYFYESLRHFTIPVVLGGPTNYTNFAPFDSFIRADDFASIRELAEYLIHLDGDQNAYQRHLWWTDQYTVVQNSPFCDLCEVVTKRINEFEQSRESFIVNPGWWTATQCTEEHNATE